MEIMNNSKKSIEEAEDKLATIDSQLSAKLQLVESAQEFALKQMTEIKELVRENYSGEAEDNIVFTRADIIDGTYDTYGSTIHPAFIKTPTNVFNFGTDTGQIFKNNANVYINDKLYMDFSNMLMHDSIPNKGISYTELDNNIAVLEVIINPEQLLGATGFNVIEILPYLPGSFDISNIKVFTMQDYHKKDEMAYSLNLTSQITDMGCSRIILDKAYDLWKVQITLRLKFKNSEGKYPLGIKHLYFLKAALDTDSYAVLKVSKDHYINTVSNKIKMHTQNGIEETTCLEQNIKLYMAYNSGVLDFEVKPSQGLSQNQFTKNVKYFYARVPIGCSMLSMKFDKIKVRS